MVSSIYILLINEYQFLMKKNIIYCMMDNIYIFYRKILQNETYYRVKNNILSLCMIKYAMMSNQNDTSTNEVEEEQTSG